MALNCHQFAGCANHRQREALSRADLRQPARDHGVVDMPAGPGQQEIHFMNGRKRNVAGIACGTWRYQPCGENDTGAHGVRDRCATFPAFPASPARMLRTPPRGHATPYIVKPNRFVSGGVAEVAGFDRLPEPRVCPGRIRWVLARDQLLIPPAIRLVSGSGGGIGSSWAGGLPDRAQSCSIPLASEARCLPARDRGGRGRAANTGRRSTPCSFA